MRMPRKLQGNSSACSGVGGLKLARKRGSVRLARTLAPPSAMRSICSDSPFSLLPSVHFFRAGLWFSTEGNKGNEAPL